MFFFQMDCSQLNHKTMFVMDHSYRFLELSGETVDVDVSNRRKNVAPSMPVTKTMWTLCVEAVMEYCRISFDLFGLSKVVRRFFNSIESYNMGS